MVDGSDGKLQLTCHQLTELDSLSRSIINFAGDLKVWLFNGEMGSGKTTLIKSICNNLGVINNVSSPTFAIINQYYAPKYDEIYHFDFYRIEKEDEALAIGSQEFMDSGNYCFVEWPSKAPSLYPDNYLNINIQTQPDNSRIIDLEKI